MFEPQSSSSTNSQGQPEGGIHQETQVHRDLRKLKHPNIIEFIATIHQPTQHYLMLGWANGGHLRSFWENNPRPVLSRTLIQSFVQQLKGLIDALNELHNHEGGYRHTDIKPENILRVIEDADLGSSTIGVLKISDMGLAKRHTICTDYRLDTNMRSMTIRYRPPEAARWPIKGAIPRRYDIWSMGCVMLEFTIWLLYGRDGLKEFSPENQSTPFFEPRVAGGVRVRPIVTATIKRLLDDPECEGSTALRDILELIRDQMLVVNLRPITSERHLQVPDTNTSIDFTSPKNIRAHSEDVLATMEMIIQKGKSNDCYWFTGQPRDNLPQFGEPRKCATKSGQTGSDNAHLQQPVAPLSIIIDSPKEQVEVAISDSAIGMNSQAALVWFFCFCFLNCSCICKYHVCFVERCPQLRKCI